MMEVERFSLGLELGNQRERLRTGVVEVKDDEARTVLFFSASQFCQLLLLVFYEGYLDANLARSPPGSLRRRRGRQ